MSRPSDNKNPRLGTVGGEAVIEGLMMKSRERHSIAVRAQDGGIVVKNKSNKTVRDKCRLFRVPFIRGIVNFVETLILSYSTLSDAVDMLGLEEEPGKFEKWLKKRFGASLMNVLTGLSFVFAMALVVGLFVYLPTLAAKGTERLFDVELGYWRSAVEGVFKVIIFVLYLFLASLLPDMHRVFMYHGAEHKTVFCYEHGAELTVENVRRESRYHPRCGTSLLFVIIIISILAATAFTTDVVWQRVVIKILLLPVVVGVGYEYIMYAGKHDNIVTRILSAPGLWMQRITTKEPDEGQMECAITALKASLPSVFPDFSPRLWDQPGAGTGADHAGAPGTAGEAEGAASDEEVPE